MCYLKSAREQLTCGQMHKRGSDIIQSLRFRMSNHC